MANCCAAYIELVQKCIFEYDYFNSLRGLCKNSFLYNNRHYKRAWDDVIFIQCDEDESWRNLFLFCIHYFQKCLAKCKKLCCNSPVGQP